jgi:hypothetical protein
MTEAADLADSLADLIVHALTGQQPEVLVALAIDGVDSKDLATRLNSTPGSPRWLSALRGQSPRPGRCSLARCDALDRRRAPGDRSRRSL